MSIEIKYQGKLMEFRKRGWEINEEGTDIAFLQKGNKKFILTHRNSVLLYLCTNKFALNVTDCYNYKLYSKFGITQIKKIINAHIESSKAKKKNNIIFVKWILKDYKILLDYVPGWNLCERNLKKNYPIIHNLLDIFRICYVNRSGMIIFNEKGIHLILQDFPVKIEREYTYEQLASPSIEDEIIQLNYEIIMKE